MQQLGGLLLVRRQTGDPLGQLQGLAADLPVGHGHVAHLALHILQQGSQSGLLVLQGQLHLAACPYQMGQILTAPEQEGALPGLHGRLDGGLLVHGQVGGGQLAAPALAGDVQGDGVAALLCQGVFQGIRRLVPGHAGHVQSADAHMGHNNVPAAHPGAQAQIAAQQYRCDHARQDCAFFPLFLFPLGRFFNAMSTHASQFLHIRPSAGVRSPFRESILSASLHYITQMPGISLQNSYNCPFLLVKNPKTAIYFFRSLRYDKKS